MPPIDTIDLAYGVPLIVVVPAIVQIVKANGLPVRLAGPTAVVIATALIALGDLALATATAPPAQRLAGWLIDGIVYGLAAAGFYSLARISGDGTLPHDDTRSRIATGAPHDQSPRDVPATRSAGAGG